MKASKIYLNWKIGNSKKEDLKLLIFLKMMMKILYNMNMLNKVIILLILTKKMNKIILFIHKLNVKMKILNSFLL